jgi:hypothetical protein
VRDVDQSRDAGLCADLGNQTSGPIQS